MISRDALKSGLQRAGLFPVVRSFYRQLNPSIREQHRKEKAFYSQILKPRGICFDVGANLGQRSEVFLGLGNLVIAVEPNATCRPTLTYLFGSNPSFHLVEKAVGPEVGSVTFYAHGTDSTSSVRPDWNAKIFGSDRRQVERVVPMTTLDELVSEFGVPDFVKIDVEGFEKEVIAGLTKPLSLLSLEFHYDELENTKACLDRLASIGKISLRPSSMDCDWLLDKTTDLESCLSSIERMRAKGDLFVWSDP